MAKKTRATSTGGDDRRPTEKEGLGFVTGETDLAQRRNLGHNDEPSFPDFFNECHRLTLISIEQCKPGTSWRALAKKLIRSRDFVELVPQLAPGLAPDSPWVRRTIKEAYGEAYRLGLQHPDEVRREARFFFMKAGGHVRNWVLHHDGLVHLQEPLFDGTAYDDFEDVDPSGADAVADERAEGEVEAVEAQVDFGALEWERLTPRQRIVGESLAYLDLRPHEIAKSLGVSKATISADMNVIRDWLLWHKTKPPPDDPTDPPDAAAEDVA